MTEQERFEQSVAARLHPARFTKVGENPLLGWNGAKDSDYVNIEMQQHWTTWQAAKAQAVPKGWVVLPVDLVGASMHLARKYNANQVHAQLSNIVFPKKAQEGE